MKLHLCTILLTLWTFSAIAQPLATDFTVTNALNDEEISLYANYLDEGKTVVIYLFFTNCPPCNSIASLFSELYQEWGNGLGDVEFIALSIKTYDNNGDIAVYHAAKNYPFPGSGYDGGGWDAAQLYRDGTFGIYLGTPTFIVVSPDGTVNYDVRGSNRPETIELLDQAIADTGAEKLDNVFTIAGNVDFSGTGVANVAISMEENSNIIVNSDEAGNFSLLGLLFENETYHLKAEKNNNPLNGVTTFDMVLMMKHILGIEPFDDPLKYIAGDVNNSGEVTTLDIIKIRKVILNIDNQFTGNTSWRFIPAGVNFSNPDNPFNEFDYHENRGIAFDMNDDLSDLEFEGVKIGDVNFSANPSLLVNAEERTEEYFVLKTAHQSLQPGNWYEVDLLTSEISDLAAYQMTVEFDPNILELVRPEQGDLDNWSLDNFNLDNTEKGWLTTSWMKAEGQYLPDNISILKLNFIAKKEAELKDVLKITSTKTKAEAYAIDGKTKSIQLQFGKDNGTETMQLFPNPIQDVSQVLYYLKEPANIQLAIFDVKGRFQRQIFEGQQEAGWQNFDLENIGLPTGIYWMRLRKDRDWTETLRFVVY